MTLTNGPRGGRHKTSPMAPEEYKASDPDERQLVGSGGSPMSRSTPSPISRLGSTGGREGNHEGPTRRYRYESVVLKYRKCTEQTRTGLATERGPVANPRQVTMAALAQVVDGKCRHKHSPP